MLLRKTLNGWFSKQNFDTTKTVNAIVKNL